MASGPPWVCHRQDSTTANGQAACVTPMTRSARPACPPPVTRSRRNHARRASNVAAALADTAGRSPHGTDGPRRQAAAGQATRAAKPTPAQNAWLSEPPACSGFAATSTPAAPPTIRISRPGGPAGRSASPVMTSQAPANANASVITHRSAAPTAARALTVPLAASKDRGCSRAATVPPATSSSGAAADETTPHHGTPHAAATAGDRRGRPTRRSMTRRWRARGQGRGAGGVPGPAAGRSRVPPCSPCPGRLAGPCDDGSLPFPGATGPGTAGAVLPSLPSAALIRPVPLSGSPAAGTGPERASCHRCPWPATGAEERRIGDVCPAQRGRPGRHWRQAGFQRTVEAGASTRKSRLHDSSVADPGAYPLGT